MSYVYVRVVLGLEMTQWLTILGALPGVWSSIPSKPMMVHNHLYWGLTPSSDIKDRHADSPHIHKIRK